MARASGISSASPKATPGRGPALGTDALKKRTDVLTKRRAPNARDDRGPPLERLPVFPVTALTLPLTGLPLRAALTGLVAVAITLRPALTGLPARLLAIVSGITVALTAAKLLATLLTLISLTLTATLVSLLAAPILRILILIFSILSH